uniref:C-type lectin domain-containing protein n=1 Tax=Salmo trutta TaxID=8032 RepID=A0A673VU51_SALTR
MADYVNKQVIELNKVNEENRNRTTRSVKTETQLSGTGRLVGIEGKMNGAKYREILDEILLQRKFNSRWYFLSTVKKTWNESREDCLERGADLVIINSDKEQQFLFGLNKGVWIGLTDSVTEETWKWVDGTPLTTPSYWHSQQPDNGRDDPKNGEEDCVELNTETWPPAKAWNDQSCLDNRQWICEKVV